MIDFYYSSNGRKSFGGYDIYHGLFNKNLKLIKKIRIKSNLLSKNYIYKNLKFIKNYKVEDMNSQRTLLVLAIFFN